MAQLLDKERRASCPLLPIETSDLGPAPPPFTEADVTKADVTKAEVTKAEVTKAGVTKAEVTKAGDTKAS